MERWYQVFGLGQPCTLITKYYFEFLIAITPILIQEWLLYVNKSENLTSACVVSDWQNIDLLAP